MILVKGGSRGKCFEKYFLVITLSVDPDQLICHFHHHLPTDTRIGWVCRPELLDPMVCAESSAC